jgi:hypothetical protein
MKLKGKGSHGSPRHTETRGPGPVSGAGELTTGHGPGPAARRVRPDAAGTPQPPASGSTAAGLKYEDEDSDE